MAVLSKIKASDNVDYNIRDDYSTWGGRNLLKGTKDFSGATTKNTTYVTITTEKYAGTQVAKIVKNATTSSYVDCLAWGSAITPEPNTQYTLSFWAKAEASMAFISYFYPTCVSAGYNSSGTRVNGVSTSGSDGNTTTTLTTTWTKYYITWTTSASVSGAKNILLCRFFAATIGTAYFAGVKLEKGTKPTDWSPALEDIAKFIGDETIELYG